MDQNFDNGFYGAQPQRPFTEKSEETGNPPQPVNPVYNFNPQKPLMQRAAGQSEPADAPAEPQGFNPVQHTATYQNGSFTNAPSVNPAEKNVVFSNQGNDFSQPVYYNPQVNRQEQTYQPPYQPAQAPAPRPPYPGAYPHPVPPKPKTNKGLVAVIIVLAVLLAASLAGILAYVISESSKTQNDRVQGNAVPGFTLPQQIPEYTVPYNQIATNPVHDESDYSDKTDKNYKGLVLADKPGDADKNNGYSAEYAFNKVSDSVVGVMCYADSEKLAYASQGSGIIISEDGYVVTNAHVIGNSKTAYVIKVITADGKEYSAGVVGFDVRTDTAVLKMDDAKGLSAAVFGDSDKLTLGEDIIIVGNPGGINYQNSMTKGIVSAIDRDASAKSLVKYIQTDAAINPGNSGGPAVNMYGQVIGIASAKIADEKYEGMGFCIPSATAKTIVDSLMRNGYVEGRVKIGISGVAVTAAEAAEYQIPQGILVETVDPDGPCGKAGITSDDIIIEADGTTITSFSDIYNVLEGHKDGDKIRLKYVHYDADETGYGSVSVEKEVEVVLQEDKG